MPDAYFESTLEECMMVVEAELDRWTDRWRQSRMIGFMIYCSATDPATRQLKNEFEYRPLPGDPTAEELQVMREKQDAEKAAEMDRRYKETMKLAGIKTEK